ncbi:MAG: efflux RND transporter periplasmic adaptor subunit [Campylobacterota bacterium]|nr:efflux RND transporter periplasmic adaptor subunit [Campylobacterota bacterium]
MNKIILGLMVFITSLSATEIYTTFNIQAHKSASLAFYSSGIVKKTFVDISSVVKKGDKLVELQNDDLKASLRIAKASLQNAEVSLKFAQKDYERQLLVKELIDEVTFDKYEMVYEKSKVAVIQAKANLSLAKSLLDRTKILAPFDGVIFEKSVEVGDVVSGMMLRTIFKIQSKNKRKLILEFDQKYWKSVKVGDEVEYVVNGDSKTYKGQISKIYPHANSDNRKMRAEVIADDFIVGLFGDGHIKVIEISK